MEDIDYDRLDKAIGRTASHKWEEGDSDAFCEDYEDAIRNYSTARKLYQYLDNVGNLRTINESIDISSLFMNKRLIEYKLIPEGEAEAMEIISELIGYSENQSEAA